MQNNILVTAAILNGEERLWDIIWTQTTHGSVVAEDDI